MSGIYIPNMEMPTEVCFVNVMLCNDGRVFVYKNGGWVKSGEAIPVPPHGRLIDADALLKDIAPTDEDEDNGAKLLMNVFCQVVKTRPTIIPAEEGE